MVIDGLVYREGLNAVGISGGVAGNVIPDECRVTVNYRFAPDKDEEQAAEVVRGVLDGFEVEISDSAPGALPGLSHPAAAAFVAMVGGEPLPKFGWTDVSRFSALGVPAVNYGPGDPSVAHQREEYCDVAPIVECEQTDARLAGLLTGQGLAGWLRYSRASSRSEPSKTTSCASRKVDCRGTVATSNCHVVPLTEYRSACKPVGARSTR